MKTIEEQMKFLAQYAGGTVDLALLDDKDTEEILPSLMKALQEQANAIGYDGFKGDADSYPQMVWVMIYNSIVKETVLAWIDNNCPQAWFRLMYAPIEEQLAAMNKSKLKPC